MASTVEAIENVRALRRYFQSVLDLADALGDMTSVEQALSVARLDLERTRTAVAEAITARDAARLLEQQASTAAQAIHAQACARDEEAQLDIRIKRDQAEATATQIVDTAHGQATKILDTANAELAQINAQVAIARNQLESINNQIAAAREAARKLLGG